MQGKAGAIPRRAGQLNDNCVLGANFISGLRIAPDSRWPVRSHCEEVIVAKEKTVLETIGEIFTGAPDSNKKKTKKRKSKKAKATKSVRSSKSAKTKTKAKKSKKTKKTKKTKARR